MSITDLRFLAVEDHAFQRRALVRILNGMGARKVYEAPDGHAALEIMRDPAHPIDIVISDLDMPGMDGMEFLRHLGESGMPISVILASALERNLIASVEVMTEAYGIGLLGIVEKPITAKKLDSLLNRYATLPEKDSRPKTSGPVFSLEQIETGLHNKEFEPFFQPKIDLVTGSIAGAEALARWRHPDFGIVAPYAFIQTVEDNGLVDMLTWEMLEKSAAFCKTLHTAGMQSTVAVNLSIKSLGNLQVADRITQVVRDQGVEPRHVVVEITESSATTEVGHVLENLARLRIKGFGLSIDDYGTGYSSMQQLARIAFTELKIDQSFVANAAKQENAKVILESSLDMARKLKLKAVAEGVETEEDWNLLAELGCNLAQGYFIARPMHREAYLNWARSWHPLGSLSHQLPTH